MRSPVRSRKSNLGSAAEILARWDVVRAEKLAAPAVWGPDGSVQTTFGGLDSASWRLADELGDLLPGTVVGLKCVNSARWIAALLAVWRAGGCVLLEDAGTVAAGRDAAERVCGAAVRIEDAEAGPRVVRLNHPPVDFGGCRPDLIKLTSGTSGEPRAVLFSAAQLLADCDQVCESMGITDHDLNYGVIAFSHSYGFSNLVTPLIARGVPVVAAQDGLPRAVLAGVAASGATVLPAVPAILRAMKELEGVLPTLRLVISAGAPLTTVVAAAFRQRFGLKVHSFYGASECGGICYDASENEIAVDGFVGSPLRGVELESVGGNEDAGKVRVRSAAVGIGYFPNDTSDALADGVFEPADLLASEGTGFCIRGRATDWINVGGRKVNPAEIERVLGSHPQVKDVVAFGVADVARTEAVVACVVAEGFISREALREFCGDQLAAWQIPREVHLLEQIPLTARGKINRRELAARFGAGG